MLRYCTWLRALLVFTWPLPVILLRVNGPRDLKMVEKAKTLGGGAKKVISPYSNNFESTMAPEI